MEIPYTLVRSSRKTISIMIKPTGEVEVRCPRRCSKREINTFVASKEAWIRKHLKTIAARPEVSVLSTGERKALAEKAAEVLPEKVSRFAQQLGVSYGRITIRSQRTRWGSCSAKGNLSFNCLLMLVPEKVLDYVIVHELCHRREMNHSAKFWVLVAQVLPNWRECRDWLRKNGTALIARLPK